MAKHTEQASEDTQITLNEAIEKETGEKASSTTIPIPIPSGLKSKRHINVGIKHLAAQRERAIKVRDYAEAEVKQLDAALLALGWPEA